MIVHCPSCHSRREIQHIGAGEGSLVVDCSDCRHQWIDGNWGENKSLAPRPEIVTPSSTPIEISQLIEAAKTAQMEFRSHQRHRVVRWACWAGLSALAISPLVCLWTMPAQVVAAFPATIGIYQRLGQEVNVYGLEIRSVELQHLNVEGKNVIAVKGELTNVSSNLRKIPWLRFGLTSGDQDEVYHWILDTEARPLKPGESTSFLTRLAAPPEGADNVEIRFARAEEISSNASP